MKNIIRFFTQLCSIKPLVYGFDPISLGITGGMALIEGLTGLFDTAEEDQQKRLKALLAQEKRDIEAQYQRGVTDITRASEMAKKQRRGIASSINTAKGISDPTAIFSGEEDILRSLNLGIAQLGQVKDQSLLDVNRRATYAEMMPPPEGELSRAVGGALSGINTGLKLSDAFGFLNAGRGGKGQTNTAGTTGTTSTTTGTTNTGSAFSNMLALSDTQLDTPIDIKRPIKLGDGGFLSNLHPSTLNLTSGKTINDGGIEQMMKDSFSLIPKNDTNMFRLKPESDFYNQLWRIR